MPDIQKTLDYSKWDSKEDCFVKYTHIKSNLIYGKIPAEKPDLSVMIPTFRRADLLKESIDSALKQNTKYSYTISVVDNDCEVDSATDKLMKHYCAEYSNIIYYRNEKNIGMFGNWNRCIELAQTEWLCLLHDDDMLMENYIDTLFPIANGSRYGAVCGFRKILDQRENVDLHISKTGKKPLTSLFMKAFMLVRQGKAIPLTVKDAAHGLFMPSMDNLLNRKKLLDSGGFNEIFFPIADVALYTKIEKYYGVMFVPIELYWYRYAQNESLKKDTCWQVIDCAANLVKAISKSCGLKKEKCNNNFNEEIIINYNTFSNAKELISNEELLKHFDLANIYKKQWQQNLVMFKYNLRWGMLLFRSSRHFDERICGLMVSILNLLVQCSDFYAPFAGGGGC